MENAVADLSGVLVDGRRRSVRNLGKKRPSYAFTAPSSPDKKMAASKKYKSSGVKKPPKVSVLTPSKPTELIDLTDACEGEVGMTELGVDQNKQKLNGDACGGQEKQKSKGDVSDDQEKQKLNGDVCGEASRVVDESGVDNHTGAPKSAHQKAKETLRVFNTYYLQLIQEEEKRVKAVDEKRLEVSKHMKNSKKADNTSSSPLTSKSKKKNAASSKDDIKRAAKRPDLKAISKMQENGQILYPEKRIGHLPGIEVGDQFFSRAEMCVLGVHSHWLNGIDYMGQSFAKQYKEYTFPLAVCIVISGMYEDDLDNSEDVIYTGQGGHDLLGSKHQIRDQKMERGNLALKNNVLTGAPVRVIRGHESKSSYCGKVYTYDGLYKVIKYWAEKGLSGYTVFKYRLRRDEGQPLLTTNQVQFTRAQAPRSISELRGLVCEDISGGQENLPIPATNVVDDPPFAPTDFEYCKSIRLAENLKLPTDAVGCMCKGECIDPRICACAKLNGGDFPYVRKDGGRLIEAKAVVFECGPTCGCGISCVNRTSQQGLKYRLEVFRTAKKGWAVRSWDTIPSGAPVCEYTGILTRTDEINSVSENNYIFDIDCLQTMKGLDGRERRPGDEAVLSNFDDKKLEPEFCIDAGRVGGVARFINHSCEPNLFVQCVLSSHHDIKIAKVMLFAADTIPPLQELSYDYGYVLDSVARPDGTIIQLPCYCGAVGCRKRLH